MPTALPRPPRVEPKRSRLSVAFNAFMLLSALVLTFIVLVREQGYANGQPGMFADQIMLLTQQVPPASGERDDPTRSN